MPSIWRRTHSYLSPKPRFIDISNSTSQMELSLLNLPVCSLLHLSVRHLHPFFNLFQNHGVIRGFSFSRLPLSISQKVPLALPSIFRMLLLLTISTSVTLLIAIILAWVSSLDSYTSSAFPCPLIVSFQHSSKNDPWEMQIRLWCFSTQNQTMDPSGLHDLSPQPFLWHHLLLPLSTLIPFRLHWPLCCSSKTLGSSCRGAFSWLSLLPRMFCH